MSTYTSDMKYDVSYRFGGMYKYVNQPMMKYDYKKNGIISKVAPAFLLHSKNKLLTALMKFIDAQFITMLMSVDKIKNFKNYLKE